jgi:hypothetical protein
VPILGESVDGRRPEGFRRPPTRQRAEGRSNENTRLRACGGSGGDKRVIEGRSRGDGRGGICARYSRQTARGRPMPDRGERSPHAVSGASAPGGQYRKVVWLRIKIKGSHRRALVIFFP